MVSLLWLSKMEMPVKRPGPAEAAGKTAEAILNTISSHSITKANINCCTPKIKSRRIR